MAAQSSQTQTVQSSDADEIGALYRQLLDSWNRRDAAAYAALFAEDASLVGFDGSQIDGRTEVGSHLGQIFADHQTGAYVGKIREVRMLAPDLALVRAVVGMVPHGQSDLRPELNAIQSLVATRQAGRWLIVLFQNTPARFDGRPQLAQQLTDELRRLL